MPVKQWLLKFSINTIVLNGSAYVKCKKISRLHGANIFSDVEVEKLKYK